MSRRGRLIATVVPILVVLTLVDGAGSASAGAAGCGPSATRDCVGKDLSRRDLRDWDFHGADLRGANLARSDLRGVDLRGARLDRANAVRADLRGADLRRSSWATSALQGADLRKAHLDRAQFSAARLADANLRDVRFGESFWTDADLNGAQLGGGTLPSVGLCDTVLPDGSVASCARTLPAAAPAQSRRVTGSPQLAVDLTRLAIRLVQRDRLNPPVASRVYALTGLALLETVQPNALPLHDLAPIPAAAQDVDERTVAASGAPLVPRALSQVPSTRAAFAAFRDAALAAAADRIPAPRFRASVEFGQGIATQLIGWSERDGFAATRNQPYVAPRGPGLWVPTPTTFQGAQEPRWGSLRTYVVADVTECGAAPPPTYSTDPTSEFMAQERAVYDTSRHLTREQRATARFWNDDRGRTGTPAGHWVATTNIAIGERHLSLGDAARLHGAVGAAVGDSFITTWAVKFRWNQIRPVTVIRQLIDPNWAPYLNTPPFPDWVSGHAAISGAAARVLTGIVGRMSYRDEGFSTGSDVRASFSIRPREFSSFLAAAREAAKSREYGGIHIPKADAAGLVAGDCVGRSVLSTLAPSRTAPAEQQAVAPVALGEVPVTTVGDGDDRSLHGAAAEAAAQAVAGALGPFSGHATAAGRAPDGRYLRRIEAQAFSVSRWPAAADPTRVQHGRAQQLVRDSLRASRRYADLTAAQRNGFVQVDDIHWVNPAAVTDDRVLDPRRPEALMYSPGPGPRKFLGVMYLANQADHGPQPGGPETTWHYHLFGTRVCMIHGGFPLELADAAGGCAKGRPELRSPEMLHVWVDRAGAPFDPSMTEMPGMDHSGNPA